jgi:nicotinamide mononucleotide transporter
LTGYGLAEAAGAVLGVIYVLLAIRENAWCWPIGLANAALFAAVFFHARLYGAAALQGVYVVLSVYGWHEWRRGGAGESPLPVSRTPARWGVVLALLGAAGSVGFGLFLARTNAALPFTDASTTAFSLVAQWMATRKWLENWLVWIAVDAVYLVMYLSQQLYATTALYAVFLVMAVFGFRQWRTSLRAGVAGAEGEAA